MLRVHELDKEMSGGGTGFIWKTYRFICQRATYAAL